MQYNFRETMTKADGQVLNHSKAPKIMYDISKRLGDDRALIVRAVREYFKHSLLSRRV